ncbi:xanthine dehydrogenase YagT iron-sulfur-binding subunit [Modicisalibacter xianhensis]|uniref:Xanthine dehydrogenase YagT iron-sulfur-binding subunit n=1 Tax=Modicisalibacter xianhensis TaxID=442341 RepID=A0A4R8G051_9GAMM|nr:(2Fe-2S)-binding protein [Halomonas xianhensis]TDX29953.1 xanthine dehydrogenase YagT iron-sulfur-binding subunit [Halomonas xianhensis]
MADKDRKSPGQNARGNDARGEVGIHDPGVTSPSRRTFLKSVGATSLAAAAAPAWARVDYVNDAKEEPAAQRPDGEAAPAAGHQRITLNVNGQPYTLDVAPNMVLLDVLRHQLDLTGTKKGCDHGQCGACTIHVNGEAINSCLSLAIAHDGDEITTVEGLERNGQLHPIQQAFLEQDAYQCGYCTSGQMMTAVAILNDPSVGSDDLAVREAMSGNICRCGAYKNILSAIQSARKQMKPA